MPALGTGVPSRNTDPVKPPADGWSWMSMFVNCWPVATWVSFGQIRDSSPLSADARSKLRLGGRFPTENVPSALVTALRNPNWKLGLANRTLPTRNGLPEVSLRVPLNERGAAGAVK